MSPVLVVEQVMDLHATSWNSLDTFSTQLYYVLN